MNERLIIDMGRNAPRDEAAMVPTSTLEDRMAARLAQEEQEDREAREEMEATMRAAAEELRKDEAEKAAAERVDLVSIIQADKGKPLLERTFPLEVASWQILCEMVIPRDKMGRFYKTPEQVKAESHLVTVAKVLMCGPTAFAGKTESGIPLSELSESVKSPDDLIGLFVIMQRYVGNDMWFAPMPGKKLRYITCTEVLAITPIASLWIRQ